MDDTELARIIFEIRQDIVAMQKHQVALDQQIRHIEIAVARAEVILDELRSRHGN